MRAHKGIFAFAGAALFAFAAIASIQTGLVGGGDGGDGAGTLVTGQPQFASDAATADSSSMQAQAAAVTDTVAISAGDAVGRPNVGFGINWTPYWDKPNPYNPAINPRDRLVLSDAEWLTVLNRLNYLSNSTMRVMVLPGWINPTATANGNVYTDTGMMHAFYRNLDYAKSRNVVTAVGYWDARQPFNGNEGHANYIKSLADMVDHLINTKNYTNIKYVILANEPQNRFNNYAEYRAAVQALNTQLQRPSLVGKVTIMGPDTGHNGTSWLTASATDLSSIIGSYEWHDYPGRFNIIDEIKDTSAGSQLKTLMQNITTADPSAVNKPLVLGEMGWFYGVTAADDQPNIGTYRYGVEVADLGIQAARNGWSSMAWYLDDQGNDKLWGMWDIKDAPALRPWFYSWSLMTRYFVPGMTLYNPVNPTDLRILAGKQVTGNGNRWSIALVNRRTTEATVNLRIGGEGAVTLSRFVYAPTNNAKDANGFPIALNRISGNLGSGIEITVPANAVVVVTNIAKSTNVDDSMSGGGLHRWAFSGGWGVNNNALTGEYNRSTTFNDNANATATLAFRGTGVKLYAHRGTGGGYAAVSVNGGAETQVSFYNGTSDGNVVIWTSPALPYGDHSIRVRVTGTRPSGSTGNYVSIDRGEVLN